MSMAASSPSTAAYVIAAAILAGTLGYFLGQGSSLGLLNDGSRGKTAKKAKKSWPNDFDVTIHPDSSDEELMARLRGSGEGAGNGSEDSSDDEDAAGSFDDFSGNSEECKLVLVVRTDLGMGKGKIAAQCSHATLACYTSLVAKAPNSPLLKRWYTLGQTKVAVQCKSEEDLLTLQAKALSLGLCARVIHDAGRTQIASGSATVLGVGPGPRSVVDQVTGHLKLL